MTLSEAIIKYRKDHDLSQRQFALKAGLSNGYISMLESNINPKTKQPLTPTMPVVKKIANAMDISVDALFAIVDDMPISLERTDYTELLRAIVEENKTGRPAAIDEIRRLFGTERSIHNIYACEDKKKIAILYYKALERRVALSLTDIIGAIDQLDGHQAEKAMLLLHAYLKAGQPIRNIVDTALEPYVEDLDELLCGGSQTG